MSPISVHSFIHESGMDQGNLLSFPTAQSFVYKLWKNKVFSYLLMNPKPICMATNPILKLQWKWVTVQLYLGTGCSAHAGVGMK